MKALKIIEYIIKVLVMLIVSSSIIVFHSFGLNLVLEFSDELGYTDLWVTIFEMSFLIIYFFIGWLLIMVLGYVLFRKDKEE